MFSAMWRKLNKKAGVSDGDLPRSGRPVSICRRTSVLPLNALTIADMLPRGLEILRTTYPERELPVG